MKVHYKYECGCERTIDRDARQARTRADCSEQKRNGWVAKRICFECKEKALVKLVETLSPAQLKQIVLDTVGVSSVQYAIKRII